jgi:SAM-dependent methyltransferase
MLCILCGEPMQLLFSARDYQRPADRTEYGLNWCDKCEFGRLYGDFTPDAVGDFYNIAYYTHAPVSAGSGSNTWSFGERLRCHLAWRVDRGVAFRALELGDPGERTVCDIGCGSGSNLELLQTAGFHVTGIEPDAKARALAMKIANVFDGTAERLPPQVQEQSYDAVLMSHVLEHCIDPHAALKNVCSILKPGGIAVIEVPNNASKGFAKFRTNWPWSDIPRHINFFTERSLSALLRIYGFEISGIRYVGYFRQFTPGWIETQKKIWAEVGTGSRPKFGLAAWLLLAETAFARSSQKYDSVRVMALKAAAF